MEFEGIPSPDARIDLGLASEETCGQIYDHPEVGIGAYGCEGLQR